MWEENGVLIALFVAVFAAMFGTWWFSGKEKIIETETSPTTSPAEVDFVDRVAPLLAKTYNRIEADFDISVVEKTDRFARGGVTYPPGQREMWLIKKADEDWLLIYSGPGWPDCEILTENEVPTKVAAECWEDGELKKDERKAF